MKCDWWRTVKVKGKKRTSYRYDHNYFIGMVGEKLHNYCEDYPELRFHFLRYNDFVRFRLINYYENKLSLKHIRFFYKTIRHSIKPEDWKVEDDKPGISFYQGEDGKYNRQIMYDFLHHTCMIAHRCGLKDFACHLSHLWLWQCGINDKTEAMWAIRLLCGKLFTMEDDEWQELRTKLRGAFNDLDDDKLEN